jgi:hypothetical protein
VTARSGYGEQDFFSIKWFRQKIKGTEVYCFCPEVPICEAVGYDQWRRTILFFISCNRSFQQWPSERRPSLMTTPTEDVRSISCVSPRASVNVTFQFE